MKKKTKRAKLTKNLDDLCRKVIRLRDNNRCQKCNKFIEGSNSQPNHVVAKGNGASWRRFDLLNIILMCNHCHIPWWHRSPTESGKWFAKTFPAREEYLEKYRYGKPAQISIPEMEKHKLFLEEKLEELGND